RCGDLFGSIAVAPQVPQETIPPRKGKAKPKRICNVRLDPSFLQIKPGRFSGLAIAQIVAIPCCGCGIELLKPFPDTGLRRTRSVLGERNITSPPTPQFLDRLDKRHPLTLHDELDDIPALAAAETLKELFGRIHEEGRRLLVMKRTE